MAECHPAEEPTPPGVAPWARKAMVGLLLALTVTALYFVTQQLTVGLAVTGLNRPAYWGLYVVNFVFFIGLSAGGIIIASLVHGFGLQEFRPLARLAEFWAISCLLLAICFIMLDVGRPDRTPFYVFWHGRPGSPLIWDVVVINLYLFISLAFGYFSTRSDLVRMMELEPRRRRLYRLLALGYTDCSERALARDQRVLRALALVGLVLAVLLHTVTAWIVGLVIARPGWFSAIMAPMFIVSATVSGLALLLVSAVFTRRVLGLAIEERVLRDLGRLLAVSIPILGYFLFTELLTVLYTGKPSALKVFEVMMYGRYAPIFWGILILGLMCPLGALTGIVWPGMRRVVVSGWILATPVIALLAAHLEPRAPEFVARVSAALLGVAAPSPWLVYPALWLVGLPPLLLLLSGRWAVDIRIGVAAALPVLGVLGERWNIVMTSLVGYAHLPYPPPAYFPSGPEVLISLGVWALGGLLYALAARFVPLVELETGPSVPPAVSLWPADASEVQPAPRVS